jgi:molybdate transport system ATP-binding protein
MEKSLIQIDVTKRLMTANGEMTLSVQLEVNAGDRMALFGVSGVGKTTILRMLAGLMKPDSGRIVVDGVVWFDAQKRINLQSQQRHIGFMFQNYALFPSMTVYENLAFAQRKSNPSQISELLAAFGLEALQHHKTTKLSGGQKQRVALARALASQPQLLLLDEPLSALDASMRQSLQEVILNAHHRFQTTTLMVSHDLSEVFRVATKVALIEDHCVKSVGTPDEVFLDFRVSGKFQVVGQIVRIEPQDSMFLVTVVTGTNQIVKVIAFDSDLINMKLGDKVMVYTKAFNPIIMPIQKG